MSTATATVQAGICGFTTEVTATSEDTQHVGFAVQSTCDRISSLAANLPMVDAYAELGAGFEGELWQAIRSSLRGCCSGCAVSVALFKAMQVAAEVALPQSVSMEFTRV